jgi:hypothetical protein
MILKRTQRRWGRVGWVTLTNGGWFLALAPHSQNPWNFITLMRKAAVLDPLPAMLALLLLSGIALEILRFHVARYLNSGYWIILSIALIFARFMTSGEPNRSTPNLDIYEGRAIVSAILPFAIVVAVVNVLLYWEPWRSRPAEPKARS